MVIKKIKILLLLFLLLMAILSCKTNNRNQNSIPAADIDTVVRRMTDIMVHDVTNPPLAARFFAYTFLAGYEIVSQNNPSVKNMHGVLNDYPAIEKPDIKKSTKQVDRVAVCKKLGDGRCSKSEHSNRLI